MPLCQRSNMHAVFLPVQSQIPVVIIHYLQPHSYRDSPFGVFSRLDLSFLRTACLPIQIPGTSPYKKSQLVLSYHACYLAHLSLSVNAIIGEKFIQIIAHDSTKIRVSLLEDSKRPRPPAPMLHDSIPCSKIGGMGREEPYLLR